MSHNRLGAETSPYLLQHKGNPVHWWPWGREAFAEARASNRPVLLSVGYAACHWCHVMAHESFENPDIAHLMNALFVNIKVDREERPDVDALYMNALTLMGEQGGWPLTMFLTPDGRPFTGGTYFPPQPRHGRPGFPGLLQRVSDLYHQEGERVTQAAASLHDALTRQTDPHSPTRVGPDGQGWGPATALPTPADQDLWARQMLPQVDPVHGGFVGAPKFPMVTALDALWRAWRRTGEAALGDAVRLSLERMGQGGLYDHLGGGFARYSTDERWLVPHFEKMLYDNAQLLDLMSRVWAEDRSALLKARIEETVTWVDREMSTDSGAFAATLDADSEGEEGRFYVWTQAEVDAVLEADATLAALMKATYDITLEGNWEGRVILNRSGPAPARPEGWSTEKVEAALRRGRALLWEARERRAHPGRDDKILADWNGLMIAALARASALLDRPDWLARAEGAFAAVVRDLGWTDNAGRARLAHAARQGQRRNVTGTLDDLAQMGLAALALYRSTGAGAYLDHASAWCETALALHGDAPQKAGQATDHKTGPSKTGPSKTGSTKTGPENGFAGFFLSATDATDLIARTKGIMDTPTPSGNGSLAVLLARLSALTGETVLADWAEATGRAFADVLGRGYPHTATLLAALECLGRGTQVVVVGEPGNAATQALIRVAVTSPDPDLGLMRIRPGEALPEPHPAAGKGLVNGQAAAYVCRGFTCGQPVTDPAALARLLR